MTSEFPPGPGGIGNHAYNLAQSLSEQGFNVDVLADERKEYRKHQEEFDTKSQFSTHRIKLHKFRGLMYLDRFKTLTGLIQQNEIILASGKFPIWLVGAFSMFYKRKFLAVIHGTEVNLKNRIARNLVLFFLRRFENIIAVSNYTKSLLSNKLQSRTEVIPNGYNNHKWKADSSNSKALPNPSRPVLVTVGHINKRKGQHNVINKLPALRHIYPSVEYHCIGIPSEKSNFLRLAADLGVGENVFFHGTLSDSEMIKIVSTANIVVMLSTPNNKGDVEGFGISIIEANALGLPSIGSKDCGIEDAINDGQSGILIEYDDTEAFVGAVKTIMENYASYSAVALKWSEQHNWDKIVNSYVEVLKK